MKMIQNILLAILRVPIISLWHAMGWKTSRPLPDFDKMIVTGAPHTSNWDYVLALMVALKYNRKLNVTIKDSWVKMPIVGSLIRALGGVGIDRSKSNNFVDDMAEKIRNSERMMMVFTPDGTRGYREFWKTGFYWTAYEAGVPIVVVTVNYEKKMIYLDLVVEPSGDIEADFEIIREYQAEHGRALYPENANPVRTRATYEATLENDTSSDDAERQPEATYA